jgi:predicted nucleic acid-binding protein
VKVFLDTSVLLSASGSAKGASRYILENSKIHKWELVSSYYCENETLRNLPKLEYDADNYFKTSLKRQITWISDTFASDKILIFRKNKDKPVLVTALASEAEYLLTLDRADFHKRVGSKVYHLKIRTPGEFLMELREAGKI